LLSHFVNILQVFDNNKERSLDKLKELYSNKKLLYEYIEKVIASFLDDSLIFNKKVFLKPNWVRHDIKPDYDIWCLRTHDNFVLAALEYFLKRKPANIVIGDAPVQSCKWDLMFKNNFYEKVKALSEKYKTDVTIKDYRRVVFDPGKNVVEENRSSIDQYTIFDLGKDSFLEPISYGRKNPFRVTSYDPARLAIAHAPGVHKYCITHELFNADLVVSMPKIKTHQKAGITAALKNTVGLNGDKDFLPHHRKGGTKVGGDCYPGDNFFRRNAEHIYDFANSRRGKISYAVGIRLAALLWRLSLPKSTDSEAAGWYGNDTTWRMVLDLNKIALFGTKEGKIMPEKQRHYYSLGDGIIGGQGDGPLDPDPLPLGVVTFTNHSGMHDVLCAIMMKFDFKKINMLRTVYKLSEKDDVKIYLNNQISTFNDFEKIAIDTLPPPGWVNYLTPHLVKKV
jgi:uncharacterized protein (DUF362 family)